MARLFVALLAAAALLPVAACKKVEPQATPSTAAGGTESETLAAAITAAPSLSSFAAALKDTDLAGALDGAAPYTLLAPTDAAFAKLGGAAAELKKPEQRAVMAAIIREHVIPGYLTPEDVEASMAAQGGKPVTMRTAGDGQVTFAKRGDTLTLTSSDGIRANIAGPVLRASNGAAIPIDTFLKKLPGS